MKRLFCVTAVLGAVVALSARESLAQRGDTKGPGGPPRSSAAKAAPRTPATRPPTRTGSHAKVPESKHMPGVMSVNNAGPHATAYGWGGKHPQPFSPTWYAEHPHAWHATHPHADVFVAATAVGLAGWLTTPAPAAVVGPAGGTVSGETSETSAAAPDTTPSAEPPAAADNPAPAAAGNEDNAQWLPLGVFALRSADSVRATRMIQLAVNHDGQLHGSHFDLLSDEVESVEGSVNKSDAQAQWRIGARGKVVFQTPLVELTKPEATILAQVPDGTVGAWKLVQVPK